MRTLLLVAASLPLFGQANLDFLNHNRPVLDAHNCYPYEGEWADRIDRALKTGFPVGIEQDMAWYVDPATGKGRAVVSHTAKTTGSEPAASRLLLRTRAADRGKGAGRQRPRQLAADRGPLRFQGQPGAPPARRLGPARRISRLDHHRRANRRSAHLLPSSRSLYWS